MKIRLIDIPEDVGRDIKLAAGEDWVDEILKTQLSEETKSAEKISGGIHLDVINDNVMLAGNIDFIHHPLCARCGCELTLNEHVPLKATLAPLYSSKNDREKHADEEEELTRDDLEFSFYTGDSVDLGTILNDEIAMHLPINYYCKDDCKGLCPTCRANLNVTTCACPKSQAPSPWDALKDVAFIAQSAPAKKKKPKQ